MRLYAGCAAMFNGVVLVDKPAGWTSHDVVAKLRGVLRERRIGHAGTLDPMATGVLTVMVGRATRAAELLTLQDKQYIARFKTGIITDTQDTTGTVTEQREPECDEEKIFSAAQKFLGEVDQVPPMYSAVKIDGKKLYELARKGVEVERKARNVTFSDITVKHLGAGEYEMDVTCSKGAYIRTLCHDIGLAAGCGAAMSDLRRVRAGNFTIDRCVTLDELKAAAEEGRAGDYILSVDSLFEDCPAVTVSGKSERLCRNGNIFATDAADGMYRVYASGGEFLMLGQAEKGQMRTVRSFFEPV